MATYKESVGTAVTNVAGDFPGAADGELWFNSTASTFQYQYVETGGARSTGGNLNTATGFGASAGAATQTAALIFGGSPGPKAITEAYNGTSWTEVNDLTTARGYSAGAGTQTSALCFGGGRPTQLANTEIYNGTNWTETADLYTCLLYTSPSPRDRQKSRMPSSA